MARLLLLVAVLTLAACGGVAADPATSATSATTVDLAAGLTPESTPEPTAMPAPTATPKPAPPPPPTAALEPPVSSEQTPAPDLATAEPVVEEASCRVIDDFSIDEGRWQVVLDGVMGGLSNGQATISDGALRITGTINTNGGGFVMVRRQIESMVFDGATNVRFVAEHDNRGYEVIVDDALAGRSRRVSHFAPIDFQSTDGSILETGTVETGTVALDELEPRSFGNPVQTEPFRPDLAFSIGVILSDGVDGDFEITLDRIEACG